MTFLFKFIRQKVKPSGKAASTPHVSGQTGPKISDTEYDSPSSGGVTLSATSSSKQDESSPESTEDDDTTSEVLSDDKIAASLTTSYKHEDAPTPSPASPPWYEPFQANDADEKRETLKTKEQQETPKAQGQLGTPTVDSEGHKLSEYERKRLSKIRKNEKKLKSLGLLGETKKEAKSTVTKKKRAKSRAGKDSTKRRRSKRSYQKPAQVILTPFLLVYCFTHILFCDAAFISN